MLSVTRHMADDTRTGASTRAAAGTRPAGGTRMAAVVLFAGFAGFGVSAVAMAISASLLLPAAARAGTHTAGGVAVAGGAVAGIWGLAVLTWTVLTLRRGQPLMAGPAVALLVAAALVHAVAAATRQSLSSGSLVVSHLAALLLTLMIVAAAGWLRRQGLSGTTDRRRPRTRPLSGRDGSCWLLLAAQFWWPRWPHRVWRPRPRARSRCRTEATGLLPGAITATKYSRRLAPRPAGTSRWLP